MAWKKKIRYGVVKRKGKRMKWSSRKKISQALLGIKRSEETKIKMREANIGKSLSEEHKKKLSEAKMGKRNQNFGKKFDLTHRIRIAQSCSGILSSQWLGGISKNPYSRIWGNTLKRAIRERDNYTCQICSKENKNINVNMDVHHIDYNKQNCNPENLISLCHRCHMKTNQNRKFWKNYFKEKIKLLKKFWRKWQWPERQNALR